MEARLNDAKFMQILQEGIEEIDVNAGGLRQAMEYVKNQGHIDGGGGIGFLQSMAPDMTEANAQAAEDIVFRMKLKPRARMWEKPGVKAFLGEVAGKVIAHEEDEDGVDGFAIVTKSGLTITHDELRVRETLNIHGNRRVLDVDDVAQKLNFTYATLAAKGVMD